MSEPVVIELNIECSECGASLYSSFDKGTVSVSPCSRCTEMAIRESGIKDGGDI